MNREQELQASYDAFVRLHGREPEILRCTQAEYDGFIAELCHIDYDIGTDIRYLNAVVGVDNVPHFRFE